MSSANRNNSKAGGDAGFAPRCSATAQQSPVEGAWFVRDDPSKHLVELCEHIILTNALQRQLIEEVILTLNRVNSGSQQLESNSAPAEEFHQQISYGTRSSAGRRWSLRTSLQPSDALRAGMPTAKPCQRLPAKGRLCHLMQSRCRLTVGPNGDFPIHRQQPPCHTFTKKPHLKKEKTRWI